MQRTFRGSISLYQPLHRYANTICMFVASCTSSGHGPLSGFVDRHKLEGWPTCLYRFEVTIQGFRRQSNVQRVYKSSKPPNLIQFKGLWVLDLWGGFLFISISWDSYILSFFWIVSLNWRIFFSQRWLSFRYISKYCTMETSLFLLYRMSVWKVIALSFNESICVRRIFRE